MDLSRVEYTFKRRAELQVLHVTVDGTPFQKENDAINHGKMLAKNSGKEENATVKKITRAEWIKSQGGEGANSQEPKEGDKHIVTQEDLDNNPELVEQGVKLGDEIELGEIVTKEEAERLEAEAVKKAKQTKINTAKGAVTRAKNKLEKSTEETKAAAEQALADAEKALADLQAE